MIKPTVGRVVNFYGPDGGPLAAIVAYVWHDRMVNLMVVGKHGVPYGCTSVRLLQDDEKPEGEKRWCEWMPYQKGQAIASETLDKAVAELEFKLGTKTTNKLPG